MGVRINEAARNLSPWLRCGTCDGYPCMVDAKSDSDILAVRPAIQKPNVTLVTEAKVLRLETIPSGRQVKGVVADVKGRPVTFTGDVVVVSCGAVNPTLTIIANALRVGDHLLDRSGAKEAADVRKRKSTEAESRLVTSAATKGRRIENLGHQRELHPAGNNRHAAEPPGISDG